MSAATGAGMLVADGGGCWAKWSRGVVFFVHCLSLLQPDAENQRLRHRYRARECKNAIKECEIANDYFPTSIIDQNTYIHPFIWYGYLSRYAVNAHIFCDFPEDSNVTWNPPTDSHTSRATQTHYSFP